MAREVQKLASVVGQAIATRRRQKGISQSELAEKLGIGADSLSRIEKGVVAPRFPRLEAIAQALECPVSELFRAQSDPFPLKFASLADRMRSLPPKMQDEVFRLVEHVVDMLNEARNKD